MSEIIPNTDNISTPPPEPSLIFFGPYGLRAGWSLLIAVPLFFAFVYCFSSLFRITHLVPPHAMLHEPGPLSIFFSELGAFLSTALATWILSKIERRPLSVYGLNGDRRISRLLTGTVLGLAAISLLVFLLFKSGFLIFDRQLLFGAEAFRYSLAWIPGFLAIGFFEEYLFRGYLQYTLARGLSGIASLLPGHPDPRTVGFWTAAFIVSFGFGAVHGSNPGESPAGLICAGLASMIFCFSLWRTGSLWWAIGMHAAWDYGESFLFGVADSGALFGHRLYETHPVGKPLLSGGATGPEGSIICLIPLLLLAAIIHFTQPSNPRGYASQMPAPIIPDSHPQATS
ncbi:MAG TPA: CPBP family intramembrane glutamic endopeptidase [Edaphobacter sp.]|nr:CPBP family intramembrane glutamic endopeptidase [Edaphobacter sp.]